MQFACDKTGFPLVICGNRTLSLLPATKVQFERYLAEPGGLSTAWYQQILQLNARVAHNDFSNGNRENLFMTGVTFQEANAFALWLHSSARLPQPGEWREFANVLRTTQITESIATSLLKCELHPAARNILQRLMALIKPSTLAQLALIRDGVMEWVMSTPHAGGLGAPRQEFLKNTFDPYSDKPICHFEGERSAYYGFRILFDHRS